jgi:hypothetical protein
MARKPTVSKSNARQPVPEATPQPQTDAKGPELHGEPAIEHPTSEINMEVHHHPEVERKTFKQYLLEGLMIFIAVLMGFIAENVRESYTEHQKAKAYAATMLADLSTDTAQLKLYINYYNLAENNVDTLMQLLTHNDIKNIPTAKLYLYGLWGGAQQFFIPNDATFQQMKSTGALQYFEKSVAEEGIYTEVRKLRSQIFEFQYNKTANDIWLKTNPPPVYKLTTKQADLYEISSFIKSNPPLLTYDKSTFNQYIEMVRSRRLERKAQVANDVLVCAVKLIASIKKEYPNAIANPQ